MSILSGLATATGVAPLLNAPHETKQDIPTQVSSARQSADGSLHKGNDVDRHNTPRPIYSVEGRPNIQNTGGFAPSNDIRYVRFVEAVQALRMEPTLTPVDKRKVADLLNKATEYFQVNDGVPREVQPLPPKPEARVEPMEEIMLDPEELRADVLDGEVDRIPPESDPFTEAFEDRKSEKPDPDETNQKADDVEDPELLAKDPPPEPPVAAAETPPPDEAPEPEVDVEAPIPAFETKDQPRNQGSGPDLR